ncbi:MAG: DUF4127 family protein [Faecousia sp.]
MKKRFVLTALILCILLSLLPMASAAQQTGRSENVQKGYYTDVTPKDWFYESVTEATRRGLLNGMGPELFLPQEHTTRAMLLTVLYRMAGEPETDGALFPDVPAKAWYAKAVAWGTKNEIAKGFEDGTFRPDEPVSREQMVTLIYRYAAFCGYDVSLRESLEGFADAQQVRGWSREAMQWAVAAGLFSGMREGNRQMLKPGGDTTRAELATILCRFCDTFLSAPVLTVGYLPLDNRPVNDLRPVYQAQSAGWELLMPEESLYATRLDGQDPNPSGLTCGDREGLLAWLKENEAKCDVLVISLDQLLSGGLVSSRWLNDTDLEWEYAAIDYLAELSQRKPVYVFDTVMRLASTVGYGGLDGTAYSLFRQYGATARQELSGESLTLENVIAGYPYGENGTQIVTELSEEQVSAYLKARARKLRLADRLLQKSENFRYCLIGIDDSIPHTSIQTNEIAYLNGCLGENAALFCGTDELGMMALARACGDLCPEKLQLSVRYFGAQADGSADSYDTATLRESVEQHIAALGAELTESGGDIEVLILTRGYTQKELDGYLLSWQENMAAGRYSIVLGTTGSGSHRQAVVDAMTLTCLLGYSDWGTTGNTVGIGLSMGAMRWYRMCNAAGLTEAENEAFAKELVFAFVKDEAYCHGCRSTIRNLTPDGIETALMNEPLTGQILEKIAGSTLAAQDTFYTVPTPRLENFHAPFGRSYEVDFDVVFTDQ